MYLQKNLVKDLFKDDYLYSLIELDTTENDLRDFYDDCLPHFIIIKNNLIADFCDILLYVYVCTKKNVDIVKELLKIIEETVDFHKNI
jgi:hypothetical protein